MPMVSVRISAVVPPCSASVLTILSPTFRRGSVHRLGDAGAQPCRGLLGEVQGPSCRAAGDVEVAGKREVQPMQQEPGLGAAYVRS
ncbi:hypothetical protein AB0C01_07055 [Micromonospora sp. NPDC048905]|uniref:hypothetical protein n=1 Tax=Micromonospora sp. NPDC048905 TaxID=3155494 RepID=UPI0033C99174